MGCLWGPRYWIAMASGGGSMNGWSGEATDVMWSEEGRIMSHVPQHNRLLSQWLQVIVACLYGQQCYITIPWVSDHIPTVSLFYVAVNNVKKN